MTPEADTDTGEETLRDQLTSVREALLDDASARADDLVAQAEHFATETTANAEAHTAAEIGRARQRSERAGQARARQELARARADSHREVLHAKEEIRRRLVEATHRAALDLRDDPRYPSLTSHLEQLARLQLGPEATIVRDPDDRGGLVATVGERGVDYSLPALADRALDALADEVAQLWA